MNTVNEINEIIEKMNSATKAGDFQLVATLIESVSAVLTADTEKTMKETEESLSKLEVKF